VQKWNANLLFFLQDNPSEKDVNQGVLVMFNIDPSVTNDDLHRVFGDYGEIKEVWTCISLILV
jgi:hypothetical protein